MKKSYRSVDMMNNQIIKRLNDGRRNMKEPTQKDGDGFYVSGVTSDYSNYKAPKASTGPAPSMRMGGSMKGKKC
jgi:hypothetical protein